jgi:hypothetical protein
MKATVIFFIISQLFFVNISLATHSIEPSHASHEGMHFHLEEAVELPNEHEPDHDNGTHVHFGLDLYFHQSHSLYHIANQWLSSENSTWLSQILQPPIPPPTI